MADAAMPTSKREACPLPAKKRRFGAEIVDWVKVIWCGMNESRSLGLAAEMAFWLFFSLLPLAAVAGLILARVAVERGDVGEAVLGSTPPAVRDLVTTQLGQVAKWNGGAVAPVAAIVFVWLASSGVHSIFDTLEVQVGTARPWWKKRLLALATCAGLSVGVAVLALLGTGLDWLYRLTDASLPPALVSSHGVLTLALRLVLGLGVAFGLIAGLYAVGTPRVDGRPFTVVPGALLAVTLEAAGGFGYGLYIHLMGTGNAYQAGLGIVGVTMMSLYLFCLALLIGAELNQAVSDRHAPRRTKNRGRESGAGEPPLRATGEGRDSSEARDTPPTQRTVASIQRSANPTEATPS
jgi:membrane protein